MENDNIIAYLMSIYKTLSSKYFTLNQEHFMFQNSKNKAFVSVFIIGLFLPLTYFSFKNLDVHHQFIQNNTFLRFEKLNIALQVLVVVTTISTIVHYRDKMIYLVHTLHDIDNTFNIISAVKFPFDKASFRNKKLLCVQFLILVLFRVGTIVFLWIDYGDIQWCSITLLISSGIKNALVLQNTIVLDCTYWRFKFLNKILITNVKFTKNQQKSSLTPILTVSDVYHNLNKSMSTKKIINEDHIKNILTISKFLHNTLCHICRIINTIYGIFHAVCVISFAVEQLKEAFGMFIIIEFQFKTCRSYLYITKGVIEMTFNITTYIYVVLFFCNSVQKEVSITDEISTNFDFTFILKGGDNK